MPQLPFIAFDPKVHGKAVSRSNLPHWSRSGCAHFVTFRLADSIPKQALADWNKKRNEWLRSKGVSSEGSFFSALRKDEKLEYRKLFGRSFETLLDQGKGACLLKCSQNAELVAECLHQFDGEKYHLGDYVIMPNHVHLLVVLKEGVRLSELTKSWKGVSAREINKRMKRKGSLWQRESFDHLIRSWGKLNRLRDYIADNPAKAGLSAGEYLFYQVDWKLRE